MHSEVKMRLEERECWISVLGRDGSPCSWRAEAQEREVRARRMVCLSLWVVDCRHLWELPTEMSGEVVRITARQMLALLGRWIEAEEIVKEEIVEAQLLLAELVEYLQVVLR